MPVLVTTLLLSLMALSQASSLLAVVMTASSFLVTLSPLPSKAPLSTAEQVLTRFSPRLVYCFRNCSVRVRCTQLRRLVLGGSDTIAIGSDTFSGGFQFEWVPANASLPASLVLSFLELMGIVAFSGTWDNGPSRVGGP